MIEVNFYDQENTFLFSKRQENCNRFESGDIVHADLNGSQKSYTVIEFQMILSFKKPNFKKTQNQPYIRKLDRHYHKVWVKELDSKKSDKSILDCSPNELDDEQKYIVTIHFKWLKNYVDKGLITKGQLSEIKNHHLKND